MIRHQVIELVFEIAGHEDAFDILENTLANISRKALNESLLECGVIPECFGHDSSEEKLWAKYCDILLAHTWTNLGIPAEVLRARGDSADVFGRTDAYTIIGDAKAFRLSRTAKNQKDFKVHALDDWRKQNTYASLISPLFQYPSRWSQIYRQAIDKNVTLLSYVHARFLLDHFSDQDLTPLWQVAGNLPSDKRATPYWEAVDTMVCQLVGENLNTLHVYKERTLEKTRELGEEGIGFWEEKIAAYRKLSQEEAVERLIQAEKINAKIETIRKAMDISL